MKKIFLPLCVFFAILLIIMSFCAVMLSTLKPDVPEDTEGSSMPSVTEPTGLQVLANDWTPWFDTYTVVVKISSSRDDTFFIGYQNTYGGAIAEWTDVVAGESYEKTFEVVREITFSIEGNYTVIVDGVSFPNASSVNVYEDTVIELVLT